MCPHITYRSLTSLWSTTRRWRKRHSKLQVQVRHYVSLFSFCKLAELPRNWSISVVIVPRGKVDHCKLIWCEIFFFHFPPMRHRRLLRNHPGSAAKRVYPWEFRFFPHQKFNILFAASLAGRALVICPIMIARYAIGDCLHCFSSFFQTIDDWFQDKLNVVVALTALASPALLDFSLNLFPWLFSLFLVVNNFLVFVLFCLFVFCSLDHCRIIESTKLTGCCKPNSTASKGRWRKFYLVEINVVTLYMGYLYLYFIL